MSRTRSVGVAFFKFWNIKSLMMRRMKEAIEQIRLVRNGALFFHAIHVEHSASHFVSTCNINQTVERNGILIDGKSLLLIGIFKNTKF